MISVIQLDFDGIVYDSTLLGRKTCNYSYHVSFFSWEELEFGFKQKFIYTHALIHLTLTLYFE